MRLPRVRFTVRRLMTAVATLALGGQEITGPHIEAWAVKYRPCSFKEADHSEIASGLRDLLTETAESLSGAERHSSWPTLSTSSNSGNAKPHVGSLGPGYAPQGLPRDAYGPRLPQMPSAGAGRSRLSSICPISLTIFAAWSRTIFRPTPPSRPPACIVAYRPPRSASS